MMLGVGSDTLQERKGDDSDEIGRQSQARQGLHSSS